MQNNQTDSATTNNAQADCLPTTTPWIKVVSPNGGEIFTAGQQITITWETCNPPVGDQIMIILKSSISTIGKEITTVSNTGTSTITLPTTLGSNLAITPGNYYKIATQLGGSAMGRIAPVDYSDNLFTISAKSTAEDLSSASDKNGKHIGYIKSISSSNGNYSLKIDYIQMNDCTPAPGAPESCNNGFEIINNNPLIRTFIISSSLSSGTPIKMQTYWQNGQQISNISLATLKGLINSSVSDLAYWKTIIPFWITLDNGVVADISEQYLP